MKGSNDAFTMRKEKIVFQNGWFIYMDGKGNNSIISHNRARMIEVGYQRYLAHTDVNRGGTPPEFAWPARGFTLEGNYERFKVDQLIVGKENPIPSTLRIPEFVGTIKINSISSEAFKNESAIEKIILHDNIHSIGKSAFEGCKKLNSIKLPNRHIEIGSDAFKGTLLYSEGTLYYGGV